MEEEVGLRVKKINLVMDTVPDREEIKCWISERNVGVITKKKSGILFF
jgi:hypothetical protein